MFNIQVNFNVKMSSEKHVFTDEETGAQSTELTGFRGAVFIHLFHLCSQRIWGEPCHQRRGTSWLISHDNSYEILFPTKSIFMRSLESVYIIKLGF